MRFSLVALLLLTNLALFAQPKINSPYSKYGIGDPVSQFFANHAGWGGQTAAFHDPFHINQLNPASFARLRATAFEAGLNAKYARLASATSSANLWSGNLAYLALGFTLKSPINEVLDRNRSPWSYGMGVALTPYTLVGYNVQTLDTLPDLGVVASSFNGSGGSYRLNWSNGVKYKNTAFGLNLGWVFGKSVYDNQTNFSLGDSLPGSQSSFLTVRREDLRINGLVWNVGIQHDFVLKTADNDKITPTRWLTIGITGESNHKLRAVNDALFVRTRGISAAGNYIDADTLQSSLGERQSLTLPATFGVGFQYVRANKLKLGAQFDYGGWASYRNEARPETMRNTTSVSGGVEYIPDHVSYNNYGKRIRYRLGAYYRQDPRILNDKGLDDIGLSFGLGLPLILPRQQASFINTAFEVGLLGANTPIEETYFRITVGFTLNDNSWFYKRRFE
ncbi:MAG: hypothetical protein KF734_15415 [Saprospiraceae bacterium]|nr:hypothetical protein [Saprospiraceae bacterium]